MPKVPAPALQPNDLHMLNAIKTLTPEELVWYGWGMHLLMTEVVQRFTAAAGGTVQGVMQLQVDLDLPEPYDGYCEQANHKVAAAFEKRITETN